MTSAQLLRETSLSGTPVSGLTAAEVADRVAAGRTNAVELRTSRSFGEIVRADVARSQTLIQELPAVEILGGSTSGVWTRPARSPTARWLSIICNCWPKLRG